MDVTDILRLGTADEWREWLSSNHRDSSGCWLSRPPECGLSYQDSVYEALCFGWIDSTAKRIGDERVQRFTPRRKGSNWTELNKERARHLIAEGRMMPAGHAVLPDLDEEFVVADDIMEMISADPYVRMMFNGLPELYVRVKIGNAEFRRRRLPEQFVPYVNRFMDDIRNGRKRGNWNDDGRLG